MDDTLHTGYGPVSFMSQRLFSSAVDVLYSKHYETLKKLLKFCKEPKDSPHGLTFKEVKLLQKVRILDDSENVNAEARTVVLSEIYEEEGLLLFRGMF